MKKLFVSFTCVMGLLLSGCDIGHGHSHDEPKKPEHHKSID